MSRLRLLIALAVAATAAALATPAAATAAPAEPARNSVLVLTVAPTEQPERHRVLRCSPTGGDHPFAAQACAELDAVHGDPGALRSEPRPCPFIYRPVTATAEGYWLGRPVWFEQTYPNECVLHTRTGSLFRF
jgi:ABC-type amino acid transport substrate-binding protein